MKLEEVKKSKILGNLDKVAQKYGFQGKFVEITTGYGGKSLFFITGAIDKCEITPEKILNSQNLPEDYFPVYLKCFNLDNVTETNEFETFFKITTYLDRLSVIGGVYVLMGENAPPATLPINVVTFICKNYVQWQDIFERNTNSEKAQKFIKDAISNCGHDSTTSIMGNGVDFTKSLMFNKFKTAFSRYPNKISLNCLCELAGITSKMSDSLIRTFQIPSIAKKSIQKELANHPHIPYAIKRVKKQYAFLVFDEYVSDFIKIVHKIERPILFVTNCFEIAQYEGDIAQVNVHFYHIDSFIEKMRSSKICFCRAESSNIKDMFTYPICYPAKYRDKVNDILAELCKEKVSSSYFDTRKQEFSASKYQEKLEMDYEDKLNLAKAILKQNKIK